MLDLPAAREVPLLLELETLDPLDMEEGLPADLPPLPQLILEPSFDFLSLLELSNLILPDLLYHITYFDFIRPDLLHLVDLPASLPDLPLPLAPPPLDPPMLLPALEFEDFSLLPPLMQELELES